MRIFKKSCCIWSKSTLRSFSVLKQEKLAKYKYLILQNSPVTWNEESVRDILEELKVQSEFVKHISGELSGLKNNYIIKLQTEVSDNEIEPFNSLTNYEGVKIVLSKELNAYTPKKGQNNVMLLVSKDSSKLIKNEVYAKFASKHITRINYISGMTAAFVWISDTSYPKFKSLIQDIDLISSYQMDLHPAVSEIEEKKQDQIDSERLKLVELRLTILTQTLKAALQNKEEITLLENERKRLKYTLKQIENIGQFKNHIIVGNSGTIIYNH